MRAAAWLVLLLLGLAGCLDAGPTVDDADTDGATAPPAGGADEAASARGPPPAPTPPPVPKGQAPGDLGAIGPERTSFTGECPGCPSFLLRLDADLPEDGWLDLRLDWDGARTGGMGALVTGPDGEQYEPRRGFDALRFKVPAAVAGEYVLTVAGDSPFSGSAQAMARSWSKSAGEARLPNIVTLVPEQVDFGACDSVEQTEQGAVRCLRLGNAIGNVGDGPVEVHLDWVQAALALAGEAADPVDGVFVQRIYDRGGGSTDRDVGASDFHIAHGHWHYDGFAVFQLFEVDVATGIRGAEAAAGHKSGFCFLDWGPMQETETPREDGGRAEQSCLVPGMEGWSMGVSAGYFDFYWAGLTDQYVEASGVGDGLYELVSTADHDDWLLESDETDNQASVLIRITGDDVEVLERRGWYDIPAGTPNL